MTNQEHQKNGNGEGDEVLFQQSRGPVGQQFGKPAINPVELEQRGGEAQDNGKQQAKKSSGLGREAASSNKSSSHNNQTSENSQGSNSQEQVLYQQSQGPDGQQFGKPAIDPVALEHEQDSSREKSTKTQSSGLQKQSQKEHGGSIGENQPKAQTAPSKEYGSSQQRGSSENQPHHKSPPHGKHNKDHSQDQEKTSKQSKWAQSASGSENQPHHGESQSPFNHLDNKPQKTGGLGSENQSAREHTAKGSAKSGGENQKSSKMGSGLGSENQASSRENPARESAKSEGAHQKKSSEKSSGLGSENQPSREHTSKGENQKTSKKTSGLGSENQASQHTAAQESHGQTAQTHSGGQKKNVKPFERETNKFEDDAEKTHQDTKWAQSALGNEHQFDEHPSTQEGHSQDTTKKTTPTANKSDQHKSQKSANLEKSHPANDKSSRQPKSKGQDHDEFKESRDDAAVDPLKVLGGGLAGVAATAAGAGVVGTVAGAAAGAAGASKLGDKIEEHEAKKQAAA